MNKRTYLRHPVKLTQVGFKTLRCRLSLKETQSEFAKRFRVSTTTVCNWEKGVVENMQRIYEEILNQMIKRLEQEGRLMPEEAVKVMFREEEAKVGNTRI